MNEKKLIENEILDWIDNFQDLKIKDGKTIRELLFYNEIPLWWFVRPLILNPTLLQIAKDLKSGKTLVKEETSIVKLFSAERYIQFKQLIRKQLGKKIYGESNNEGDKVIVFTLTKSWKESLVPEFDNKRDDSLVGSTIEALKDKKLNVLCVDIDYSRSTNLDIVREKIKNGHITIEAYFTRESEDKAFEGIVKIKKLWNELKADQKFKDLFVYNNVNIWEFLKSRLDNIFSELYLYSIIRYIEAVNNLVEVEKPKALLTSIENAYFGLAAIYVCRPKGIPVIGIQHAMITPVTPGYIYKKIANSIDSLDCPVVDKFATYGDSTKEILTKISCYSEDSIVITGQPKYDIITKIKSSFNREEFCKKWGIDPNRKIAMLLTQILSSEEERSIYLRNVLKAFKEFPEIQVVIKPKANEEWHKQVLVEEGVTDGVVLPNINAYEPMYISDFVSTVSSTAAVEAMFFDKPVLIVNLTNRSDALPLIQSGATVAVTDVKDLATSVKKILYDKETHELLAKAREKFVNDQVYKLDGKSSERVAELVESLINKKEK